VHALHASSSSALRLELSLSFCLRRGREPNGAFLRACHAVSFDTLAGSAAILSAVHAGFIADSSQLGRVQFTQAPVRWGVAERTNAEKEVGGGRYAP
jgi:hypothetical protein